MDTRITSRQHGAVLAGSLIFLVVATMLVITATGVNSLEERMASNSRDHNLAFQAAEAALADGKRDLDWFRTNLGEDVFNNVGGSGCALGICKTKQDGSPIWVDLNNPLTDAGWSTGKDEGNTVGYGTITGVAALAGVASRPRYILEYQTAHGDDGKSAVQGKGKVVTGGIYRVTARGYGLAVDKNEIPISQVTLQAMIQSLQ